MEPFAELFELNCPKCDSRLAVITFPTYDEVRKAAATGDAHALAMMPDVEDGERLQETRRQCRQRLAQLPRLDGTALSFTLDTEDSGDRMNPDWLILKCQGNEIYREPSGFEWWKGVIEIGQAVKDQYGDQAGWYDPSNAGFRLLGDSMSAEGTIHSFLNETGLTPPTGPWSHPRRAASDPPGHRSLAPGLKERNRPMHQIIECGRQPDRCTLGPRPLGATDGTPREQPRSSTRPRTVQRPQSMRLHLTMRTAGHGWCRCRFL
jgi:hypothetical protein